MTTIDIPAGIDPEEFMTWKPAYRRAVLEAGGHLINRVVDDAGDEPEVRYDCSCEWTAAAQADQSLIDIELERLRHLWDVGHQIAVREQLDAYLTALSDIGSELLDG
jgi:hypothetical protein